jgi:competence protein ComEC
MFERARLTLAQHVYARLSGDVAAMTATRLNGEQTSISKPVIEAMRIAGLAHLLSTSGFHVTIMGLLVYFPLRALLALIPWIALRYPIKKWAAIGAILSATAYSFLVGSQAATLRSMLMTGIAMLAIIVDRRSAPMRLVILSAALVMLLVPDAMPGPSFQMSFAAVFCLIAFNERAFAFAAGDFENLMPQWMHSFGRHMWLIARTSLIATAATTPFAIYHFQAFSFYGFVANMLAIPLTSFWVMPCILMAYITAPLGLDGWFIDGAGGGIWITIKIAEMVAR